MRILDIDLDFFVSPIARGVSGSERLPEDEYALHDESSIRSFLETRCGLSTSSKVPGKFFVHHDEVFEFIRDTSSGMPIDLVHVDAHSDTDGGLENAWLYLGADYLHKPLSERLFPERGIRKLNCGNFIIFLAACGLLERVSFVFPAEWEDDWQDCHFRGMNPYNGFIELRKFTMEDYKSHALSMRIDSIPHEKMDPVPISVCNEEEFEASSPFDLVLVTQSPNFTPKSADRGLDIIAEYLALL